MTTPRDRSGKLVFKRLNEQQLIDLWWSDKPMSEIAWIVSCSDSLIRNAWRTLKAAGKIPDQGRNQRHLDEATIRQAEEDRKSSSFFDMRPSEIKRDLLLERLIAVHGPPR